MEINGLPFRDPRAAVLPPNRCYLILGADVAHYPEFYLGRRRAD